MSNACIARMSPIPADVGPCAGGRPLSPGPRKATSQNEWKEYPTRTLDVLESYERPSTPVRLSKYGGWFAKRTRATGYFRVEKTGDRWWLIDPDGYHFLHVAVTSVNPGRSANTRQAYARRFGDNETWVDRTQELLKGAHFNGLGGWSTHETFTEAKRPMPYIIRMSLMSDFGKKLGLTHRVPGHTGFELGCIPVFHPDFPRFCESEAQEA